MKRLDKGTCSTCGALAKIHVLKRMECRNCCDTRSRKRNPELAKRQRESCKAWHNKNPEYQKETNRKRVADPVLRARDKLTKWNAHLRKFGLVQEDYDQLLKEGCQICKRRKLKAPHLDHCHETGKFRGLLCSRCNNGLGMLGDNTEGLERAIKYLKGANSD